MASGLLPWVSDGPGSSYRGVELAAALRNTVILPDTLRWAGLVVLAVALIGVVHLATLALTSPGMVWLRAVSGGAVLVLLIVIAAVVGVGNWGVGLWSALLGAVVAVCSAVWMVLAQHRSTSAGSRSA